MLLAGHPGHEQRLAQLLADPDRTAAVLWPAADSVSMAELRRRAARRTGSRITLVAVDSTWPGARRMAATYPLNVLRVRIDPAEMPAGMAGRSLMAPLRKYRPNEEHKNRCGLHAGSAVAPHAWR